MRGTRRLRSQLGAYLAETAATMAFAVPLCFYALFVAMEACQVYSINQALQQAARAAARNIATTYATDPGIVNNTSDQSSFGYAPIVNAAINPPYALANAIGGLGQFSCTFNKNTTPMTVTVTVVYTSGQNNLPQFPQIDPLFLGQNYKMAQQSTYILE